METKFLEELLNIAKDDMASNDDRVTACSVALSFLNDQANLLLAKETIEKDEKACCGGCQR